MATKIDTYARLADTINARMGDENLRKLLFDVKQVEDEDLQYIGAIERIADIAYLLIYLKWAKHKNDLHKNEQTPHCRNVFCLLEKVYAGERLCLDVVIYTLTEAERDVMQAGKKSFFADILTDRECHYGHIYDLVYNWTNSFDFCESNLNVIFKALLSILESVGWFENIRLFCDEAGGMTLQSAGETYACGDYFCRAENRYCLLESYELISDGAVRCKYACLGNSTKKFETVKTKE